MRNYFNYFTEIEERFQGRRGSLLMLSTLDWALIETWREAGLPLEIVLRGIDLAFDHYDARLSRARTRLRKPNGLAWCAPAVLEAAQAAADASLAAPGPTQPQADTPAQTPAVQTGFEPARVAAFLQANAARLLAATGLPSPAETTARLAADRLRELAVTLHPPLPAATPAPPPGLEELDRVLSTLEEKLVAALLTATPETELTALREQASRELAPYRGRMQAVQIRQVQAQFLHKRLLEAHDLPRLSLFYMGLQ